MSNRKTGEVPRTTYINCLKYKFSPKNLYVKLTKNGYVTTSIDYSHKTSYIKLEEYIERMNNK